MPPRPRILEKIRAAKKAEVEELLKCRPAAELERAAAARLQSDPPRDFRAAVTAAGPVPNVIAELKQASPSQGVIRKRFDPTAIAAAYRRGGAAALSCLTDEKFFRGKLEYLALARDSSGLPVLRKDFLIHPAQVFETVAAGADALLLIARILEPGELLRLYRLAKSLGLEVLLEIHDEDDLEKALAVGPSLLGVNNRDLDNFTVEAETVMRLRELIPSRIPVVAASGIETFEQMRRLGDHDITAVLVGESLMRAEDIEGALRRLRGRE